MTWSEELACGIIGAGRDAGEPIPEPPTPIAEQTFGPGPLPDVPLLPDLQLPVGQPPSDPAGLGLPGLPPLPEDPVGSLLNGLCLPALPGVDTLMKPMLDLLGGFGTGVLPAFDPTAILEQSSQIIELAMQTAVGALHTVDQVWQGRAAHAAQAAGHRAHAEGRETSEHGIDIAGLTNKAAATVARGNAELTAVAQSFAAEAAGLAPVILTPPAQTALIAAATEHLGQAVTIVNATRAELDGYTTQLGDVVEQLIGTDPDTVADTAQTVAQHVGEPLLSQAQQLLSSGAGHLSNLAAHPPSIDAARTALASVPGMDAGTWAGGHRGGGVGGHPGAGLGSAPSPRPGPGMPLPDAATPGMPFGPGSGGSGSPTTMLGGSQGARGRGGNDEDHTPTTGHHREDDAFTAGLEHATLGVIGTDPSEEFIDYYRPDSGQ